jgi:hypothetical protein
LLYLHLFFGLLYLMQWASNYLSCFLFWIQNRWNFLESFGINPLTKCWSHIKYFVDSSIIKH